MGRTLRTFRWIFLLMCLGALTSGCVKTFHVAEGFNPAKNQPRVLIMPSDVELSALTAAGLTEPRADWTAAGKSNVDTALGNYLNKKGLVLKQYAGPTGNTQLSRQDTQLFKLHSAVGKSILLHKYIEPLKLPSKKGAFDWTLGDAATRLREQHDADYALFIYMRDSFATGGRAAVILVGAILGVGVQGGQQAGFASLVDLRTGSIAWFNVMQSGTGDLREADSADSAIKDLLKALPI